MLLPDKIAMSSIIYYFIPLSLNFLSLILSFLMLVTFMKYKRLRINSGNGNLSLSIVFLEFLFSAFLFANFFYADESNLRVFEEKGYEIYPQILPFAILNRYDILCQISGGFFIFLILILLCLNTCLSHNLFTCVRNKAIQDNKNIFAKYLIFSFIISFGVCLYAFLSKDIGNGEFGYCGIKENSELEIIVFLALAIIFSFNIFVGVYVLKNRKALIKIMKQEQAKKMKDQMPIDENNINTMNSNAQMKNPILSTFGMENMRTSQKCKNLEFETNNNLNLNSKDKDFDQENNNINRNSQKGKIYDPENNSNISNEISQKNKILDLENNKDLKPDDDNNIKALYGETSENMHFAISNFEVFIKINLYYILVFMINWIPMEILSSWGFGCFFASKCETSIHEDIIRLIGLYIMCSNAILLFLVRIKETQVKKKMTKLLFVRRKGKKKTDDDIKSKLIKHAIKNEKNEQSVNNTELCRFDSNFSFQMMMKNSPKNTVYNKSEETYEIHGPETRSITLITSDSKDYSLNSEEKAEDMNDMMKIFLTLPYLFEKLENLLPESQYSEVLITAPDEKPANLSLQIKGSFKESPKNPKQYHLWKSFSLKEGSAKKKNQEALKKEENQNSKKGSFNETKDIFKKKSMFKQPPWRDYLYNKYYLEEVEISDLVKDSFELKSKYKTKNEKITCVAYNKEYFDMMFEFSEIKKEDIKKAFNLLENYENLKKIEKLKNDFEIKTENSRFFLKIIQKDVKKFLVEKYFKSYHLFIHQQKKSFLPKILGLFSFQFHSNNTNISFILYENPFIRSKKLQEKADILGYLRINPLKIEKRIIFNEEKIAEHYHRSYSFTVKEDDLKLKKEDKNRLMGILKNDLDFLAALQAVKYSFVMFFYKFNDEVILNAMDSEIKEEIIFGNKSVISHLNIAKENDYKEDFALNNGIGYCIGTFYDVFKFLNFSNKKKKKIT